MIYSINPIADTTIYEASQSTLFGVTNPSLVNTGLDAILDITKEFASNYTPGNSRILIKFDLAEIATAITASNSAATKKYYLNLYATNAREIPINYTLYAYPVSQSWNMGTGRYGDVPQTENGASWVYRSDSSTTSSAWRTSSYSSGTTGSYLMTAGGGTWFTESVASQSFSYSTADIRMDVSAIVYMWLSGSIPNEGLLLKKSEADETSTGIFNSLKFFSRDTSTIYTPKLEIAWDDSSYTTGSLSVISDIWNSVIYPSNNIGIYDQNSKVQFRLGARSKYPARSFGTSSVFLTIDVLPSSSYYGVKTLDSEDYVIPFSDYTLISCDATSNYFNMWMGGLQPERYYKIILKIQSNGLEEYVDNDFIFKVAR